MSQTTLTVSYVLSPPEGTNPPPSLGVNGTHAFAVPTNKMADNKAYYEAVRNSIAAAREKVGEELTAWRDAVGGGEAGKEQAAKAARAEEEDEEENDDAL